MSSWAHFRKVWVKPEVYPLIGAMGAAVAVCGAAIFNKVVDPTVTWNKGKRTGAVEHMELIDEVKPMWHGSKHLSTTIFGSDYTIMENKKSFTTPPPPMVIKFGDDVDEEDEEEVAEVVEEPIVELAVTVAEPTEAPSAIETPAPAAVPVDLSIVDDAAEAINSAIDAAIEQAEVAADPPKPAAPAAASVNESAVRNDSS